MGKDGVDSPGSGSRLLAGCCECGNEHWVSENVRDFLTNRGIVRFSRTVLRGVI
jgi:hypothetical protein